jgi:hypothetical protein
VRGREGGRGPGGRTRGLDHSTHSPWTPLPLPRTLPLNTTCPPLEHLLNTTLTYSLGFTGALPLSIAAAVAVAQASGMRPQFFLRLADLPASDSAAPGAAAPKAAAAPAPPAGKAKGGAKAPKEMSEAFEEVRVMEALRL